MFNTILMCLCSITLLSCKFMAIIIIKSIKACIAPQIDHSKNSLWLEILVENYKLHLLTFSKARFKKNIQRYIFFCFLYFLIYQRYFIVEQPGSKTLCFFYLKNVRHMCFPIQKQIKTHVFWLSENNNKIYIFSILKL
jgi:hypothetical protein